MSPPAENFPVVLVVEDEALVRGCVAGVLEDAGCCVIEAADAEGALVALRANSEVTTVFTDINMPGPFDGLSLAHKIIQLHPRVRLILTSGRSPPEDEMPAGGLFLPKPYDCNALTALILAA
jgi:DNA-binding NtrC family response regulator